MSMALMRGGKATHINGTATTTAAVIPALTPQESAYLHLFNEDATNSLLISFDAGRTFFAIRPQQTISTPIQARVGDVRVQSSAATVAYRILWISVV